MNNSFFEEYALLKCRPNFQNHAKHPQNVFHYFTSLKVLKIEGNLLKVIASSLELARMLIIWTIKHVVTLLCRIADLGQELLSKMHHHRRKTIQTMLTNCRPSSAAACKWHGCDSKACMSWWIEYLRGKIGQDIQLWYFNQPLSTVAYKKEIDSIKMWVSLL